MKPGTEVKLRLVLFNHVEGDEVVAQLNNADLKRGANTFALSVHRTGPFPPSRPVNVEKVELHLKGEPSG